LRSFKNSLNKTACADWLGYLNFFCACTEAVSYHCGFLKLFTVPNSFPATIPVTKPSVQSAPHRVRAMIGMGANLGDAQTTLNLAIVSISAIESITLIAQSRFYASAPVDADGDDYVNAVIEIETTLEAIDLLHVLQKIETEFGRQRSYRNAPRTIDLDLLLYAQDQIALSELTVPHPRIAERAFVLLPLLQIDPEIVIPGLGLAAQFVDAVQDQRIHPI